eukprot:1910582-Pleurochrysis_carterae.AAC.2
MPCAEIRALCLQISCRWSSRCHRAHLRSAEARPGNKLPHLHLQRIALAHCAGLPISFGSSSIVSAFCIRAVPDNQLPPFLAIALHVVPLTLALCTVTPGARAAWPPRCRLRRLVESLRGARATAPLSLSNARCFSLPRPATPPALLTLASWIDLESQVHVASSSQSGERVPIFV